MAAQGWYVDPFGAHEHRWFSDGVPTDLVRDAGVESSEIPPTPTWDSPLPLREAAVENDGADLRRADDGLGEIPADEPAPPDSVLMRVVGWLLDVGNR